MGLHIDKPAASFELSSPMPKGYGGSAASMGSATPFPGTPGASRNIPKKMGTNVNNAFKKPQEIFAAIEGLAEYKANLRFDKTFILAVLAGAYIALGGAVSVMMGGGTPATQASDPGLQKFFYAAMFPFGIVLVVILGGELVTSNMSIMPAGALAQRVSFWSVLRNWFIAYFGNLAGSLFVAGVLFHSGGLDASAPWSTFLHTMAAKKVHATWAQNVVKGIGCNWMVCAGYWSATASEDIIGKIFALWMPILAFVLIGFEHSVANMFLIPAGMMAGADVTVGEFIGDNLIPVTIGNIIGALFLALPYWWVYWVPSHPISWEHFIELGRMMGCVSRTPGVAATAAPHTADHAAATAIAASAAAPHTGVELADASHAPHKEEGHPAPQPAATV